MQCREDKSGHVLLLGDDFSACGCCPWLLLVDDDVNARGHLIAHGYDVIARGRRDAGRTSLDMFARGCDVTARG
jgi:hypothetical protein